LPRRSAIHPSRLMIRRVRVRVELSMARRCPGAPWVTSPARERTRKIANWAARRLKGEFLAIQLGQGP
jgi:hypothetical protein